MLPIGGVSMTPGRLLRLREVTPVSSRGSVFVYVIPPQNVMLAQVGKLRCVNFMRCPKGLRSMGSNDNRYDKRINLNGNDIAFSCRKMSADRRSEN